MLLGGREMAESQHHSRFPDASSADEKADLTLPLAREQPLLAKLLHFVMSPDERPRVGSISGRECGQPRSRHPENECFDVTFDPLERLEPERSDVERAPKSVPGCSVNNDRAGLATALQASCEMYGVPRYRLPRFRARSA